jgi:hypothetical protein
MIIRGVIEGCAQTLKSHLTGCKIEHDTEPGVVTPHWFSLKRFLSFRNLFFLIFI